MIETKECLSGHLVPVYEFGMDRSKPDRLNLYCKNCIRNHRNNETAERNERGLTAAGTPLCLNESERAIERERQKREAEKEIEARLAQESFVQHEIDSSISVFSGLSGPTRQGDKKVSGWSIQ